MAATCPPKNTLSRFAAGRLSSEDIDEIAAHLETCGACQAELETVGDQDDLLQALELADDQVQQFSAEPACACLVAQMADASRTECESFLSVNGPAARSADERTGREPNDTAAGVRFGQYVLLRQIGRGGMGAVYQALHTHLERVVAIKMLASDRMKDADAVARFEREMRAVGRLEHPQIVRAMDAGEHDGVHFLAMEFVHGPDVSAVVNGVGPLRIADACEIARQAAFGLDYAFRRGLVHRDIKPSNLMLDVGEDVEHAARVRVLDFGLALLEDNRGVAVTGLNSGGENSELTGAGQLMGTLDYIAPEQIGSSHDVDVRADIYSLGATLFKLLTGTAPFARDASSNPAVRLHAIRNSDAPLVSGMRSDLPVELAAFVARMLSRDPAARPQTPMEVAGALAPFADGADLRRLALTVWNPEATLVTLRELPSILAKQRELLDATLPHLLPSGERPPREPTTDRLQHDETGTRLNAGGSRTRESSGPSQTTPLETSANRSLTTSATGARRAVRWIASVAVLVALGALAISKWRAPVEQRSPITNAPPKREPAVPIVAPFNEVAAGASQQAWADELGVPVEFENSIGMRFRVIPPGKFTAGLTSEEVEAYQGYVLEGHMADLFVSSAKQREVTLSKPFAVGVTEVTVEQFARFVDATGHVSKGDGSANSQWRMLLNAKNWSRLPIASINWHDAVAFADWLGKKEGATYSLPTEAEWEFACRAGRVAPLPESKPEERQDGDDELTLSDVAWVQLPKVSPRPVGQKRPNAFGLHDMLGNVAEWCHDNFVMTVDSDPTTDPVGPPFSDQRVIRGGTLANAAVFVRPSFRNFGRPIGLNHDWGFRLVRRFDDSADSRGKFLRPARELDELPTPLGENSVEVGIFGYVDVPNLIVDVSKPITMELFVTPRWTEFRETRHVGGSYSQFSLFVTPDERGSGWSLGLMHTNRFQGLIAPARLEAGRRTHVAGVRDGKVARVFVDGKLVMQQDEFKSPLSDKPTPFHLGGLMATLDEARLSDVARYDAEFTPRTRFESDEHTVGLWHFDEGTGTQATDASGRGHHAVLSGARWTREAPSDAGELNPQDAPQVAVAPQVVVEQGPTQPKMTFVPATADANNALLFGNGSRVVVPSLKLAAAPQLTLEMFATLTGEQGTDWRILGGFAYQSRILTNTQGRLVFANELARKRGNGYADAALPIRGQRFHLAGVIDGETIRFFVNGIKATERIVRNFELTQPGSPFTLGGHADGAYPFPGVIDEVRLSSVARYADDFDPVEQFDSDDQTFALYHCDEADGERLIDSSGHEHHGQVIGATRLRADSLRFEFPPPSDVVYLDDLPEALIDVHPDFAKHGLDHQGEPIEYRSQRPTHTLMVHPHANGRGVVEYDLGAQYEQFEGIAAITSNEPFGWRPVVPLTFRVLGDDKLLWTSPPLKFKGAGQEFRIFVRDVKTLRLEAVCPGDNTGAHCFWLAPRLLTKESLRKSAPATQAANSAATMSVEPAAENQNNALLFRERGIVTVPSLHPTPTSELTIECFTTATDDRSGDWQFVAGWPGQPRLLKMPSGHWAFGLQTADGKHVYAEGPLGKVGERLHLAGVYDGSTARLFVNGELISDQPLSAELFLDARRPLTIGSRGDGSYQFAGLIDEIRLSNSARYRENFSPAERLEPDEQTRALFHCDETGGEQLLDSSSHGHHGELRGAFLVRAGSLKARAPRDVNAGDQPLPAALQFDGVDDFVSVPSLQVDGHGPYTLELWLWQEQQRTQQFPVAIWGQSAGMQLQTNNGLSLIDGLGAGDTTLPVQVLQPPWPSRRRIHVAFGWHEQTRSVFVNGRKQSPQVQKYSREPNQPHAGTLIGARSYQATGTLNHFAGRIDELRLSNTLRYANDFAPDDEFSSDDLTLALYKFDEADGSELRDSSGNNHHGRIFGATWVPAIEPVSPLDETAAPSQTTTRTLDPSDGWVELAATVRFSDDVVAGTWRLRDNGLDSLDEAQPGAPPRLLLPVVPSGGYEFEFTVTRLTGDGAITAHLPVGQGECVLQLEHNWPGHSERIAGLQFLNGQRVFSDQNPTRTVIEIENNRPYKLTQRVELLDNQAARVQVRLDDKPLIDWTGPQTSLGADPRWRRDPLGIGTSDATTARFENIRFRVLTGEARQPR